MPAFVTVISIEYIWPGLLQSRITCNSDTCAVFGPTACVNETVCFVVLDFLPSSSVAHSPYIQSVVLRSFWNSTRNFDFVKSIVNRFSKLIGNIVWINCRPSCIESHSAVLIKLILFCSESLESDMSVGNWSHCNEDTKFSCAAVRLMRDDGFVDVKCIFLVVDFSISNSSRFSVEWFCVVDDDCGGGELVAVVSFWLSDNCCCCCFSWNVIFHCYMMRS